MKVNKISEISTPTQFLMLGTLMGVAKMCSVTEDKNEYTAFFEAFIESWFNGSKDKFTKWLQLLANKNFKNQPPHHQPAILMFVEEHNKVCLTCTLTPIIIEPPNPN
jgi:hypothetical protein